MSNKELKLNDFVKHKKSNKVYIIYDSGIEVNEKGEYKPVYDCIPIRKRINPRLKERAKTFFRFELTKNVKGGIIA